MPTNDGRDHNVVQIPGGGPCPRCGTQMQRYKHNPDWKPLANKGFYTYWERCTNCKYPHNPPDAYVKGIRQHPIDKKI